jgi:hypothetical protein
MFEALPKSIVRRYFLQVPALLNLRFPGSRMPVGSTGRDTKPTEFRLHTPHAVMFKLLNLVASTRVPVVLVISPA